LIDSTTSVASVPTLEGWVREHCVTWETQPRRESTTNARAEIELTLLGRYPGGHFPAGGDGCVLVFDRLQAIACHALESVPEARYRIDPFDAAVRVRTEESWAPEVELTLVLEAAEQDPSAAELRGRLLPRIESGLEQLGVQRKHWRES
jgi:hypothetical protein